MIAGLRDDFPAIRSLEYHATNLPAQPTALIGRHEEREAISQSLESEVVGVVTLTGPGGTGKTRLALQVATELLDTFTNGVFFVDLSALNDPALVIPTIARTLGLRESSTQALTTTLTDYLKDKSILLALDNFEQVVDAATEVAHLASSCPRLKLLVTSREPLRISGEREYPVPPLALPDSSSSGTKGLLSNEAIALFVERAQAHKPDFVLTDDDASSVVEICRRLDGLPLAIELAAARIKILPPRDLLARLNRRLKLLTLGPRAAPRRQQTLRSTIEWSYTLLAPSEQRLFARLSIFVGGCTLEAAEDVCTPEGDLDSDLFDGISSLVEKSLLRLPQASQVETRFSMLETIREYALERLEESSEGELIRRRHAEYFLHFAQKAESHTIQGSEQLRWLERLEQENDNLRTALTSFADLSHGGLELRMAVALRHFWRFHSHLTEGRKRLQEALARGEDDGLLRTQALSSLGLIALSQGGYEDARRYLEQSLALSEQMGFAERVATNLNDLGCVALAEGDYDGARSMHDQSMRISREINDTFGIACANHNLANVALNQGEFEVALELAAKGLTLWRQLGDSDGIARSLLNSGLAALHLGNVAKAAKLLPEGLQAAKALGSTEIVAGCLDGFAAIASRHGELERAGRLLGAAEGLRESIGAAAEPFERDLHEKTVSFVTAGLGDRELAIRIAEGRSATVEAAIADTLPVAQQLREISNE